MPWVAYYGGPGDRIFGRVEYESENFAKMDAWNHWCFYDAHDTDIEETPTDRWWKESE
jgi:hypothetical protein